MPSKRPKRALRAVVSEIEDGFVVSISTVSDESEMELLAEETVKGLGLAEAMIKQTAEKLKHGMNDVDLTYNLYDGIFTKGLS